MAKITTKPRKIYYKKAVFMGARSGYVLQSLLQEKVFANENSPKTREEPLLNGEKKRLINSFQMRSGMFFGQMIAYNEGAAQSLLTKTDDVLHYEIESIRADEINTESNAEKEFVESTLYFAVYQNHLVVMQSQALTIKMLESHLDWLLHDYSSAFSTAETLMLQDRATLKAQKQIEKSGTKNIKLGTPVKLKAELPDNDTKNVRWKAASTGAKVIRSVLGRESWQALNISDTLDDENIVVELTIKYNRKTSEQGQEVLDEIATAMRHQDTHDYRIELKNGDVIEGGELKISNNIGVSYSEDGRVIETELFTAMRQWLLENIDKGHI